MWGAVSGGLSWPLWLTIMNGLEAWREFDALGTMVAFGGAVGAVIGLALALYCVAARRRALAV
jgi:hypothetical protein